MADRDTDAATLRAAAELAKGLVDAIEPFVRHEPRGRIALSVFAARARAGAAELPEWSAGADGAARVQLRIAGAPATVVLRPGRLVVDDGLATIRTRCRVEGAPDAAAAVGELLDAVFGHVPVAGKPPPDTRVDDGVVVWERRLGRCEALLALQRALGRELAGELAFRFAGERVLLDVEDQQDPRWDASGGPGVFDPWPFAVWLFRRHVKLQRPALRVAIEPGGPRQPAPAPGGGAKRAPRGRAKAAPRKAAPRKAAPRKAAPKKAAAEEKRKPRRRAAARPVPR